MTTLSSKGGWSIYIHSDTHTKKRPIQTWGSIIRDKEYNGHSCISGPLVCHFYLCHQCFNFWIPFDLSLHLRNNTLVAKIGSGVDQTARLL